MTNFFKKALGVFVEFEENNENTGHSQFRQHQVPAGITNISSVAGSMNAAEISRFEKHFEQLFEMANLPGPDYFEFWKMMETLEPHIPDEKARISATFSALSIQGLNKEKLLESASKYIEIIKSDKDKFEKVVNDKAKVDVDSRKHEVKKLEESIVKNSELIQKLTKEITTAQASLGKLKTEITEEESKLARNRNNYSLASEALKSKIATDINKIQSTL
ncbi:MAG: hypothetical protein ACXWDO_01115 [Bacteroidia bacterium]